MKRHGYAAIPAGDDISANVTLQKIMEAATVHEDDALTALLEVSAQRLDESRRYRHRRWPLLRILFSWLLLFAFPFGKFGTQIYQLDRCERAPFDSIHQTQ